MTIGKSHPFPSATSDQSCDWTAAFAVLCDATRAVANAPSFAESVDTIYQLLRERFGLISLYLELNVQDTQRSYLFGGEDAAVSTRRTGIEHSMVTFRLHTAGSQVGVVRFKFASTLPAPDEVLPAVALQIEHRLQQEARNRRVRDLLNLSTLSRSLISTTNLDQLLEHMVEEVVDAVSFSRCCIFMRDGNRPQFVARMWRGYSETIARNPVKEGEGAVGQAARAGRMLTYDRAEVVSADRERERSYLQMQGFARALGTGAFVAAPILGAQGRCMGVLVADNRGRREPISAEQCELLSAFVNQAGIAVDNCILYAQMQDTLANIRRLKDYTDRVFNSIEVGIVSTDGRGVIVRWNPAALGILGKIGKSLQDILLTDALADLKAPEDEHSRLVELVRHTLDTGESGRRQRITLHPADRSPMTITLMVSRLPEHNQERSGVVLIFEDVTQEARMEAELAKMRRLADIGQLAAKMAHEVRNALSPIRAAAQIIRGDIATPRASAEWTDIIVAEVDGLARLTSEMLDFARPTPLELTVIAIGPFLESALHSLRSFLEGASVSLDLQVDSGLGELSCDPVLLSQGIRNIVLNAVQAMPDGGTIHVRAWNETADETVCIEVKDSGEGIAAHDLERIFRPFVTTRPKGTGLGLPIVQKIVDQHGGRIDVSSHLRQGTRFRIHLPLHPPPESGELTFDQEALISRGAIGKYPDP